MVRWGGQKQVNIELYSEEQVRRTLLACGIDIVQEIESDFIIYCPYHNNHRTPAAEVSKTSGDFYCFGCHESRDLVQFVMFCSKRNYFEAMRLIHSKKAEDNIEADLLKILDKKPEYPEFDTETVSRLNDTALVSHRAAGYLKGRGITKDSVEKYKIGYSEKQDMITIPIYSPDGICVGMVGRSVEGKEFKNTPGLPRSKTMFNIQRNKTANKIFLVESSFDAIRIEQVGGKALATLGSNISNKQKDLLKKYFTSIIVVSDNDEAGRDMKEKLSMSLGSIVIQGDLSDTVKDVSDLDDEQLKTFINTFDNEIHYILQ
jgi:DNA primase